jgi:hypothetical protein
MMLITFLLFKQEGLPDNWPIPMSVMNTYCFIMSTFILPRHLPGPRVGDPSRPQGERLHPGVGPEQPGEEREYQAYYQWVPFVLFLQARRFQLTIIPLIGFPTKIISFNISFNCNNIRNGLQL